MQSYVNEVKNSCKIVPLMELLFMQVQVYYCASNVLYY